jgi:hypothetical protein
MGLRVRFRQSDSRVGKQKLAALVGEVAQGHSAMTRAALHLAKFLSSGRNDADGFFWLVGSEFEEFLGSGKFAGICGDFGLDELSIACDNRA